MKCLADLITAENKPIIISVCVIVCVCVYMYIKAQSEQSVLEIVFEAGKMNMSDFDRGRQLGQGITKTTGAVPGMQWSVHTKICPMKHILY